ncbi:MAG TPA: hypothetical protein VK453_25310 [Micromonosporaceae bacterium]|nr:hypothetical protein [Micromonosporaceae bacterium]
MKRLIAAVLTTVAAMALVVLPASSASAHPNDHTVAVSGSMYIHDSDFQGWDDEDVSFHKLVVVSGDAPVATMRFQGCADEVRVVLDVTVVHEAGAGRVNVTTRTRLYEGASCATTDLDQSDTRHLVNVGISAHDKWTTRSDGNYVTVRMTVTHRGCRPVPWDVFPLCSPSPTVP